MGIPPENAFVLEDGDVLELDGESGRVVDTVDAGHVFVDGRRILEGNSRVHDERRRLSRDGIVTAIVTLSQEDDALLIPPVLVSSGYLELDESQSLFEKTSKVIAASLDQDGARALDLDEVKARVTRDISDFLHKETRRRPTVVTVVERV